MLFRSLALAWGVHAIPCEDVSDLSEMIDHATDVAVSNDFASAGDTIVMIAGVPFGNSGKTNLLHVATVPGAKA